MAAKVDAKELAQISFYLAKASVDFDSLIDADAGLERKTAFQKHDFTVNGISCRFIYFETGIRKTNPPWLDFVNGQLPKGNRITFTAPSRNANGILMLKVNRRTFAATFGRSAGSALIRKSLEPDFGIKAAMNLCGNEEIRQTRTQNNSVTPTHIDRQVSKPSETFVFGLSEAEDLKYISAQMKGNTNITLQGRDSLTVKVLGSEKLSWERLITQCRTFLTAYGSKDYVDLFPNYRNFKQASEGETLTLDGELIKLLKANELNDIQLCIPEFMPDDEFSFSYTDYNSRDNRIYSHLDTTQLKTELDLTKITVSKLQAKYVYAYSHADDRILSNKRWSLYDCLVYEHKLNGKYFILSDGRWLEVDPAFYASIIEFIQKRLHIEPCEDIFKGIAISDNAAKKNLEGIFNATACSKKPECILFDRAQLRIGTGRKNKEFCDILDFAENGLVRIINCKPMKGASSLVYLFAQAKLYCQAFLTDDTLLADIRNHIGAYSSPFKQKYLDYIPKEIHLVKGQDYRVCLWLLYDQREKPPTGMDIPLIAQFELKLLHDHLMRLYKFSDIILRFVPVQMISYTRQLPPKVNAA